MDDLFKFLIQRNEEELFDAERMRDHVGFPKAIKVVPARDQGEKTLIGIVRSTGDGSGVTDYMASTGERVQKVDDYGIEVWSRELACQRVEVCKWRAELIQRTKRVLSRYPNESAARALLQICCEMAKQWKDFPDYKSWKI